MELLRSLNSLALLILVWAVAVILWEVVILLGALIANLGHESPHDEGDQLNAV
jgi:hypothetical protein